MKAGKGNRLIFVGGTPRSGTTLIQNMLDSHPAILGGPEFDRLPDVIDLRDKLHQTVSAQRIDLFCSKADIDQAIADLIENLLLPLANQYGTQFLSEKTPFNVLAFNQLLEVLPECRCVFVVRDPRAVISSMQQVRKRYLENNQIPPDFIQNLDASIECTKKCLQSGFKAREEFPHRLFLAKYEKAVSDPELFTQKLCQFLNLDWSERMTKPGRFTHLGEKTVRKDGIWYDLESYYQNPNKEMISKWETDLSPHQKKILSETFRNQNELTELGYDFSLESSRVTSRPDITLTLINYNKKPFIKQALNSILDQSLLPDKVILFDDCSTDGSDQILKNFADNHGERFQFIQSDHNLGSPAASMNRVLDHVNTEIWTFMSADDYLHPDCIHELYSKYKMDNYDVLLSNVIRVDTEGNILGKHFKYIPEEKEINQAILGYKICSALLKFVRTKFIKKIGGYDQSLLVHEDHEHLIRMVLSGKVSFCKSSIYYYRITPDGFGQGSMKKNPEIWGEAYKYVYQKHYLSKNLLTTLDWKDALEAQHEYLKRTTGIFQWIENTPAELKHFAMHQYHQGEFQHSIKHFRKALQLTPWDPDLLISLGKVHYDLGNYTQARNYLERTLSIKPGDEDARMGISLIENKLDTVSKQGIPH